MTDFPLNKKNTHLFEVRGKRFALDIPSCVFLETDEKMWDAILLSTTVKSPDKLRTELSKKYKSDEVAHLVEEFQLLVKNKIIFSEDHYKDTTPPSVPGIATLSLNLSQKCNLRCRYCFAKGGSYGQAKANMTESTAKATIDFFFRNSCENNELSLCFFGGEPLLNFGVMQETVDYASKCSTDFNKKIRFNVTTNGTVLTSKIQRFLSANNFGVIVSIDGDQDAHDAMRIFKNGHGSYNTVRRNLELHKRKSDTNSRNWTLRGTFTRNNLDLISRTLHLVDLGFHDISIEPCLSVDSNIGIQFEDLPILKEKYLEFADVYIESIKKGRIFSFFHFHVMMDQTKRATRRLSQCSAGRNYFAISSDGEVYPCHRLVGNEDFKMGDVWKGIVSSKLKDLFRQCHANTKPQCTECWARYICGGGCHACAIQFNGDIWSPYGLECELIKHRIELGAYLYSMMTETQQGDVSSAFEQAHERRPYLEKNS